MPKVYDVVTGFNELQLYLLRLNVLDPFVDTFIINESPVTFTGQPKPLFFQENKEMFKKFEHKIIYHTFEEDNPEWTQWDRDRIHKNGAMQALEGIANNDDIIFYSDCDEIWNPENISFDNFKDDTLYILYQSVYYYFVNCLWENVVDPTAIWRGSRYSSYKLLKQHSFDAFRAYDGYFFQNSMFKKEYQDNKGWHFSFLNGAENIKYKIQSYGHQEMNIAPIVDNIQNNINSLRDPFFRPNFRITPIPITLETHPKYLVEHLDEYSNFIYTLDK
jgi:beta-1,4-mannosyl-glycoprotein beta-1,4-N-acetylglucosaminyltransferase